MNIRGRCIQIKSKDGQTFATFLSERGAQEVVVSNPGAFQVGDLVRIENGSAHLLTRNRTPEQTTHWTRRILDPRRIRGTEIRKRTERAIAEFFESRDFREVRTPLLVPCPGMETHIRPFKIERDGAPVFLPTSPEFAMKKLLVGGLERIYQLTPAFRDEPHSMTHLPEFTLVEWYRADAGYEQIMKDTEELVASTAQKVLGSRSDEIRFQGNTISLRHPWPRLRVRDLFLRYTGIDLVQANTLELLSTEARRLKISVNAGETWDDVYFKIFLNLVEPELPADQAVFVTDYPPSQAALATLGTHEDGTSWAKRFEAYIGGIELCNAFEELTDPIEQRKRFVEDMELREQIYGPSFPKNPLDEEFLEALSEGLPPSGGNALGVDRLIMLLADEPDIHYTFWLS